jgi:hypothetical protein
VDWLGALGALSGLIIGCALLFAAAPRAGVLIASASGLLVGIALGRTLPGVQAAPEWAAVLTLFGASAVLVDGGFPRLLSVAALPITAAAGLAATAILEVAWASIPLSLAGVLGAWVIGSAGGYVSRRFRHRSMFVEAALLALLVSLALIAAPTALVGWQRAAIAAEGDDSKALALPLGVLWPVGGAFFGGFAWRAWHASRHVRRRK